jgi:hypothetical protein
MLTRVRNGNRPALISDSMLMQLPTTAALHEQDAARAAEVGAGDERHAFFFRGQGDRVDVRIGERTIDENM